MAIQVQCSGCGKQYTMKDEMAGRKVRCPQCKGVIAVPGGNARPAVKRPPVTPSRKGASVSAAVTAEMPAPKRSTMGKKTSPVSTCPGCGKALKANAVSCEACGYNIRLGRRMSITAAIKNADLDKGVRADGSRYVTREEKADIRVQQGRKVQIGLLVGVLLLGGIIALVAVVVASNAWWGLPLEAQRRQSGVIPAKINESGVLTRSVWFHPWCTGMKVDVTIPKADLKRETVEVPSCKGDAFAVGARLVTALRLPWRVAGAYPESMVRRVLFEALPALPENYTFTPSRLVSGVQLQENTILVVRGSKQSDENGYLAGFLLDCGDRLDSIRMEMKKRREKRLAISGRLYFIPCRKRDLDASPFTYGFSCIEELDRIPAAPNVRKRRNVSPAAPQADPKKEDKNAGKPADDAMPRYYFLPVVYIDTVESKP